MTAQLFTLRDFTAAICAAEGRTNIESSFNQLKGLQGRGLLQSTGTYAFRGAALFEQRELFRARILIAALDAGVRSDDLAKLNGFIADRLDEVWQSVETVFWLLEIARVRDRETDALGISCGWERNGWRNGRPSLLTPAPEGEEVLSLAGTIESVLFIRVSDLLHPLKASLLA